MFIKVNIESDLVEVFLTLSIILLTFSLLILCMALFTQRKFAIGFGRGFFFLFFVGLQIPRPRAARNYKFPAPGQRKSNKNY